MSGFNPDITSHGNYRCPYCNHKIWKIRGTAENHIANEHRAEAEHSVLLEENKKLRAERDNLKSRITIQSPLPPPKEKEYYDAIWYCHNCLHVHSGGLPKGVLVENVTCGDCGISALHLVTNVERYTLK